jgi:Immunoglobulin-like domain of bacterial spore germination/Sporulation and spore germination
MNTPMPTDHEIEVELQALLRAEAEQVTPEPALHKILVRAHEADRGDAPTKRRRRWLPALAGAVATAGIAAVAIVVFAPSDDPSTPRPTPSNAVWPTPCDGCPLDLAVFYHTPSSNELISGSVTVESTGDVGVDAVNALLRGKVSLLGNPWSGLASDQPMPIAEVNSVTPSDLQANDPVTVDFDGPLSSSPSMEGPNSPFSKLTIQQLVLTVQSALRTNDPVLITINGEPAEEAFEVPLSGPIQANGSLVTGIRLTMPAQRTAVDSPVRIFGRSSTYEGNVLWEVTQDGEQVKEGFTTGGAPGTYGPFSIRVRLDPGMYTVKLWEPNAASGPEAWTDELSVVYVDILVE